MVCCAVHWYELLLNEGAFFALRFWHTLFVHPLSYATLAPTARLEP